MKKLLILIMSVLVLTACGGKDPKEMYSVENEQEAQQDTLNVELKTDEKYSESDLKKIIIDASSQYDHNKVHGIRFNIVDADSKGYAEAKIAFDEQGMNATGVKKKNIAEITMK